MDQQTKWQNDPLYRLGKSLYPIPTTALFFVGTNTQNAEAKNDLLRLLENGEHTIRDVEFQLNSDFEIYLKTESQTLSHQLINTLRTFSAQISENKQSDQKSRVKIIHEIHYDLTRQIHNVLDAYRDAFLREIIIRQQNSQLSAQLAREKIQRISKKIFYVSLNASVEASRAGENGAVFNVISQEVRRLAKNAETSLNI